MQVAAAMLCDFASVRDNLLFVIGGCLTRLYRDEYPAAMGVSLALTLELHRMELGRPHELHILVLGADGEQHAEIQGGFNAAGEVEPGETLLVPIPFDLRAVGLPAPGRYSVEISVDGTHHRTLPFRLEARPAEPPGLPA